MAISRGWRLRDYEPSPALALREIQCQTGASLGRAPMRSLLAPRADAAGETAADDGTPIPCILAQRPPAFDAPDQARADDESAPFCGDVDGGRSDDGGGNGGDEDGSGGDGGWSDGSDGGDDDGGDNGGGCGWSDGGGPEQKGDDKAASGCADQENGDPNPGPGRGSESKAQARGAAQASVSGLGSREGACEGGAEQAPPSAKLRPEHPANQRLKRTYQQRKSLTGAPGLILFAPQALRAQKRE